MQDICCQISDYYTNITRDTTDRLYTGQPVLHGASTWELKDFTGVNFYCHTQLITVHFD